MCPSNFADSLAAFFIGSFSGCCHREAALVPANAGNRDAQTKDDVEGTKVSLESQGEGVHVRKFDFLREVPDICDLRAEADHITAERASSAGVPPAVRGRGWGRHRDWFSRLTTL